MDKKNSYEITNPVFNTAKMTSFFLAESGNPFAKKLIERTGFDRELAYNDNPMFQVTLLPNMIGQDVRYEAINRLVREAGNKNILDFACGFSPRGIEFASEGYIYHGGDLQMVVPVIEPLVKELAGEFADSIDYYVVDVTDLDSCLKAAESLEGPITVITEGLMPYLNDVEKQSVFSNIAAILKKHGGCYICPDFNTNEYALSVCMNVMDEGALEAVIKTQQQFSKKGDSDTDANMVNPLEGALKILENIPLKVDIKELYPESANANSYSLVDEKKLPGLKKAVSKGVMLTAVYDAALDTGAASGASRNTPFSVACKHSEDKLVFTVSGRMDSLTSPQVVDRFDEIADTCDFETIEFDFTNLEYISSAGLRVLLTLKKRISGDLFVLNAVPAVKEIFATTGFDQILVVV